MVDRPIGYRHGDILYPVNYGYVPGLPGGDGEEQDAYILGISKSVEQFTGKVIGVIRRHNDCEDKLVVAPEGQLYHQGQIAEAVHFQEQYFLSSIDCLQRKSCGVIPYRMVNGEKEFLLVYEKRSKIWSLPKGHMEAGETEVQTALRELYEETGLSAQLDLNASVSVSYPVGPRSEKEVVFYLGEVSGDETMQEDEIEHYHWVSLPELKDYLFPDTVALLEKLLRSI